MCEPFRGCVSVYVFICIVYIMPTIYGISCHLVFSMVLYKSCKQLGGCMSGGVFICIVYIMPTIWMIYVCVSVGVFIGIVHIMPTIQGVCVSWCLW